MRYLFVLLACTPVSISNLIFVSTATTCWRKSRCAPRVWSFQYLFLFSILVLIFYSINIWFIYIWLISLGIRTNTQYLLLTARVCVCLHFGVRFSWLVYKNNGKKYERYWIQRYPRHLGNYDKFQRDRNFIMPYYGKNTSLAKPINLSASHVTFGIFSANVYMGEHCELLNTLLMAPWINTAPCIIAISLFISLMTFYLPLWLK